jgi:hypothetical protein
MVYAALVFGDANHLVPHRTFHSRNYSCVFDGICFRDAGTGEWRERLVRRYLSIAFLLIGVWVLLFCGGQLGHLLSNRHDFGDLMLIKEEDRRVLLRPALFTQTLYLSARGLARCRHKLRSCPSPPL